MDRNGTRFADEKIYRLENFYRYPIEKISVWSTREKTPDNLPKDGEIMENGSAFGGFIGTFDFMEEPESHLVAKLRSWLLLFTPASQQPIRYGADLDHILMPEK